MNAVSTAPTLAPLEGRPMSVKDIHAAAHALGPRLRAAVDSCNELGCLPDDIMEALRDAGVFRIGFPAYLGGPEMPLTDQVKLVETISTANPSAGWCTMILADSGYFAGMLDPAIARQIWPRLDMATSAVSRPPLRAVAVAGGYSLSGRLGFASGVRNADRIAVHCHKYVDGSPELDDKGQPQLYLAFPDLAAFAVHDAWDTIGMRGTGSTQISIENGFVPEDRFMVASFIQSMPSVAPLSRHNMLMALNGIGVILGVSRCLLDMVEARIATKKGPDQSPLAKEYRIRVGLTHAWGYFEAASAYVYDVTRSCDARLAADEPIRPDLLARISMMMVLATELCRKAVDAALDELGSDHIFRSVGIEKLYADLRVASTHILHRKEALNQAASWREEGRLAS